MKQEHFDFVSPTVLPQTSAICTQLNSDININLHGGSRYECWPCAGPCCLIDDSSVTACTPFNWKVGCSIHRHSHLGTTVAFLGQKRSPNRPCKKHISGFDPPLIAVLQTRLKSLVHARAVFKTNFWNSRWRNFAVNQFLRFAICYSTVYHKKV